MSLLIISLILIVLFYITQFLIIHSYAFVSLNGWFWHASNSH